MVASSGPLIVVSAVARWIYYKQKIIGDLKKISDYISENIIER